MFMPKLQSSTKKTATLASHRLPKGLTLPGPEVPHEPDATGAARPLKHTYTSGPDPGAKLLTGGSAWSPPQSTTTGRHAAQVRTNPF